MYRKAEALLTCWRTYMAKGSSRARRAGFGLVVALVGAVLGVAVDRLTQWNHWNVSLALLLVALACLALLLLGQEALDEQRKHTEDLVRHAGHDREEIRRSVAGLYDSLQFSVEMQMVDELNRG